MGQHQTLLWWILLLDLNTQLLKKNLYREGGIPGLLEVTVMGGYLMEIYVSVDPFASTVALLLGLTV